MTVKNLKEMLNKVINENAEILLIHDGDNFYDGRKITGIMIMHHFTTVKKEEDICRVFIEEE